MKTLEIYFYCIEIAINSNIPKKEKLFCSNKFCREKLFIFNCEWKFIAERGFELKSPKKPTPVFTRAEKC
jgi:hypothetical protein